MSSSLFRMLKGKATMWLYTTTCLTKCCATFNKDRVGFRLPPNCWLVFVTYPQRGSLEVWITRLFGFGRSSREVLNGRPVGDITWWLKIGRRRFGA